VALEPSLDLAAGYGGIQSSAEVCFLAIPAVRGADLEGRQRVELGRSTAHRRMTDFGPTEKSSLLKSMSAIWGSADQICSE
jgi:hypothetical protein